MLTLHDDQIGLGPGAPQVEGRAGGAHGVVPFFLLLERRLCLLLYVRMWSDVHMVRCVGVCCRRRTHVYVCVRILVHLYTKKLRNDKEIKKKGDAPALDDDGGDVPDLVYVPVCILHGGIGSSWLREMHIEAIAFTKASLQVFSRT